MPAQPLEGVRILDLTRLLPGGLCTLVLADLGAEVIKIEQPPFGDYARTRGPFYSGPAAGGLSASFVGLSRGKRSLALDLKDPDDRASFLALVPTADVVIESFRPGVMERLGFAFETLVGLRSQLVYCAITGWGYESHLSRRAGHDINYLASVGLLSSTGGVDEEPMVAPVQIADTSGALYAVSAVLAGLRQRDASGLPQFLDVSLSHVALAMASMSASAVLAGAPAEPHQAGLFSGGVVCYQAYRCVDGWVALGALEEKFWRRWCRGVGREDLYQHRYEHTGSAVHGEVAAIFSTRTRDDWETFAATHDCCLTVVAGMAEALDSAHVRDRSMVVEVEQDELQEPVEVLGPPLRASWDAAERLYARAPALGEYGLPVEAV